MYQESILRLKNLQWHTIEKLQEKLERLNCKLPVIQVEEEDKAGPFEVFYGRFKSALEKQNTVLNLNSTHARNLSTCAREMNNFISIQKMKKKKLDVDLETANHNLEKEKKLTTGLKQLKDKLKQQ